MTEDHDFDLTPDEAAELEAGVAEYAAAQARDLGMHRAQYTEHLHQDFWQSQVAHTTLLISGLSLAHDELATSALRGLGFNVEVLESPDNESLQYGKEFGNRGQCNPTWFTVGNLVKHLVHLRDRQGIPTQQIIDRYVFVTAGACGPCRFGMYVTEYRKALRDAGFDGFRVLLFQMAGGIKQATGEELGLKIDAKFAWGIVRALIAGDVLNLLGYRIRPYEVTPGSTDTALRQAREVIGAAFERNTSVAVAMLRARRLLGAVEVDRSRVKPVVSVIGEFWAMTTEGDGNYHMQRFLEREGAEVDVQGVTNWLLFMLWEARWDTQKRQTLRHDDAARKGLAGKDATKKLWGIRAGEVAVRALFQTYATAAGLHGYHLPDMDDIAARAAPFHSNAVRGGEGHMEVGKLIHFVEDQVNHMTVSVKPFGCMPSSGVSDGVQTIVTTKWPDAIFIPIETTGDQEVNAHSRVQMMLFKARQKARAEFEQALAETGTTEAEFAARLRRSRFGGALARPRHKTAGLATNLVYALSRRFVFAR